MRLDDSEGCPGRNTGQPARLAIICIACARLQEGGKLKPAAAPGAVPESDPMAWNCPNRRAVVWRLKPHVGHVAVHPTSRPYP